jgi:hypothetical protein
MGRLSTTSNEILRQFSIMNRYIIDRGFEPRSGQTKDYEIGIVASPLSTQHLGVRTKTGWLGIRIMCQSGARVMCQTGARVMCQTGARVMCQTGLQSDTLSRLSTKESLFLLLRCSFLAEKW